MHLLLISHFKWLTDSKYDTYTVCTSICTRCCAVPVRACCTGQCMNKDCPFQHLDPESRVRAAPGTTAASVGSVHLAFTASSLVLIWLLPVSYVWAMSDLRVSSASLNVLSMKWVNVNDYTPIVLCARLPEPPREAPHVSELRERLLPERSQL